MSAAANEIQMMMRMIPNIPRKNIVEVRARDVNNTKKKREINIFKNKEPSPKVKEKKLNNPSVRESILRPAANARACDLVTNDGIEMAISFLFLFFIIIISWSL